MPYVLVHLEKKGEQATQTDPCVPNFTINFVVYIITFLPLGEGGKGEGRGGRGEGREGRGRGERGEGEGEGGGGGRKGEEREW